MNLKSGYKHFIGLAASKFYSTVLLLMAVLTVGAFSLEANSALSCRSLFEYHHRPLDFLAISDPSLFAQVLNGREVHPRDLMLNLEHFENYRRIEQFKYQLQAVTLKTAEAEVEVIPSANISGLAGIMYGKDSFTYYLHPTNTSEFIHFYGRPDLKYLTNLFASSSASRSLFFQGADGATYSIKLPTNFPNGPGYLENNKKIKMKNVIYYGLQKSQHVSEVEKKYNASPLILFSKDIMSVTPADQTMIGRYGSLAREAHFLDTNEFYYIPALSVPFIGEALAEKAGINHLIFWRKYFAESIGRAKADLLLYYGLSMLWPHGQNLLIEIDKKTLLPTGRIVIRDLSDMKEYVPIAKFLKTPNQDELVTSRVDLYWERTAQVIKPIYFEPPDSWKQEGLLDDYKNAHDIAFKLRLAELLKIPALAKKSFEEIDAFFGEYPKKIESFFRNQLKTSTEGANDQL